MSLSLADLEERLPGMTDRQVVDAFRATDGRSKEAELLAGEMERRNLDD